jgi:DNA recombination protein RmuC
VATPDGTLRPDMVVRLAGGKNITPGLARRVPGGCRGQPTTRAGFGWTRTHGTFGNTWTGWRPSLLDGAEPVAGVRDPVHPGRAFLAPALERDPGLLEYALSRKVHIATPPHWSQAVPRSTLAAAALADNARYSISAGSSTGFLARYT